MQIDKDETARLTEEYGGKWGLNHTRRVLQLVSVIAEGIAYDRDAVWLAAYLHDWGAYSKWARSGVDHDLRSAEVAEEFLRDRDLSESELRLVLECIRTHHSGDPDRSIEAVLLSDADGLDFLGVVGILRDFSKSPRDLRAGYESAKARMEKVPPRLSLNKTKAIAAERVSEMAQFLNAFEEGSFGYF
jgi:HD superfamily phosphodiesterase